MISKEKWKEKEDLVCSFLYHSAVINGVSLGKKFWVAEQPYTYTPQSTVIIILCVGYTMLCTIHH